jgi:hypothetical protein
LNVPSRSCALLCVLVLLPAVAFAGKPNWARKATGFPGDCKSGCRPLRIVAPDKTSVVEVFYQDGSAYLRVIGPDKQARAIHDAFTSSKNDLLWSPDSKAFFVDGGEGMTSPGYVQVFQLDDPDLRPLDVTRLGEKDMVKTFPPCKALYLDPQTCRKIEADPGFNITAIDWADDSKAIVVMAQIPCTSNYGGITCQVMGYELEMPSGRVLTRMTPAEFREKWHKSMEQRLEIPEAAQYQ